MSKETPHLTPTQALVMEVLGARRRLGENLWTFDSRYKPTIRQLEDLGLADLTHGINERTVRASLTDEGARLFLDPNYRYRPQGEPTAEQVYQAWHGTTESWGGCADRHAIERILNMFRGVE